MKESIKSIIQWHETTFPDAAPEGQIDMFMKELRAYEYSPSVFSLANMFILACEIARFDSVLALDYFQCISDIGTKGLQEAIDTQMEINRTRK